MSRRWMQCRFIGPSFAMSLAACAPAMPALIRPEGQTALVQLGVHYADMHAGAQAILSYTDAAGESQERLQVVAGRLATELGALQQDFEETTAALRTDQLDAILPLWERMAMAQAGLSMLQQEAAELGQDPAVDPDELQAVAEQLEAVLELALAGQQGALENLKPPAQLIYPES